MLSRLKKENPIRSFRKILLGLAVYALVLGSAVTAGQRDLTAVAESAGLPRIGRGDTVIPLNRFIDMEKNFDLLANGILFTKPRAAELIESLLGRLGCCAGGDCSAEEESSPLVQLEPSNRSASQAGGTSEDPWSEVRQEFFMKVLGQQLKAADVFRITLTSFLDAYNFDLRRLMKCCVHHVLPSGHVVPFCAYNVLYRDGHVQLPPLVAAADRLLNVGK